MSPASFLASLSTAGRVQPVATPEPKPQTLTVDRWNAVTRTWDAHKFRWDGVAYVVAEVR